MRRAARAGFTLVEILAALAVLAVGLAGVMSVIIAARNLSVIATDRNNAKMLISDAVADIERVHLITATMPNASGVFTPPPGDVGLLIETLPTSPNPNTQDSTYGYAAVFPGLSFRDHLTNYLALKCFDPTHPVPASTNTLIWPFSLGSAPKYTAGTIYLRSGSEHSSNDLDNSETLAYRIVYRLERQGVISGSTPTSYETATYWQPHTAGGTYFAENPNSPYAGMYVLTLTAYRDMTRNGGRLEQITDPVVVYLLDKKVR